MSKKKASQDDRLGAKVTRLAGKATAAAEGDAKRNAVKALKRAQRKKSRLVVLSAGGKNAMEKAAKAAKAAA
jgi:hypothetical protein